MNHLILSVQQNLVRKYSLASYDSFIEQSLLKVVRSLNQSEASQNADQSK